MLKAEVTRVKKFNLWWRIQDKLRGYIAICLFKLGFEPQMEIMEDERMGDFPIFGYGHTNYDCDIFQFTIPLYYSRTHKI